MGQIEYPNFPTEFELHAQIFCFLRREGIDVRGEVKMPFGSTGRCSFDLVVFKNKIATSVIEVKKTSHRRDGTRQNSRYRRFGVPVIYFWNMKFAPQLLEMVR